MQGGFIAPMNPLASADAPPTYEQFLASKVIIAGLTYKQLIAEVVA